MKLLTEIIGGVGILVLFSSLFIMKYSDKNEEKIFRDHKDLPYEEFDKLRRKYVYNPHKWAFYVALTGNLLLIPNALFNLINQDTYIMGAIELGVVVFNISLITITKR